MSVERPWRLGLDNCVYCGTHDGELRPCRCPEKHSITEEQEKDLEEGFRKPLRIGLAKQELAEAQKDFDTACDIDSGDDFSYDACSATAARLHAAERRMKDLGLIK